MTQELSTTSILSLFETDKQQRESFVNDLINRIDNGEIDPLRVHLQVKCVEDITKLINSNTNYKSAVLEASENQGQKSFQFHNAKFEIKEVGVKYDFSKCEDIVLNRLYDEQERINKLVKYRETMLKTVSENGMIVTDEETGETFTVYPPSKSSTTSVAVTLK